VRKRTRRRLHSSRLFCVPVHPEPREAMKGMLWRGHAIQGRCQPGRRAVLEETKEPSDRNNSTLGRAFSQGNFRSPSHTNLFIYYQLQGLSGLSDQSVSTMCSARSSRPFSQEYPRHLCYKIADNFIYSPPTRI